MVTITTEEHETLLKRLGRTHKVLPSSNHDKPYTMELSGGIDIKNKPIAKGRHKPGVLNKTESEYASMLAARNRAGEITWWRFEAIKLKLADKTFLTPDFAVMLSDGSFEFHETKGGFIRDDAIVKLKVAAEMYPFFRFVLCKKDKTGWSFKEV